MKKIVKLTENDINKLVNKVIKEQGGVPPRPLVKQERNRLDLGLFEKFFMGTHNANDKQFVTEYIQALKSELQSANVLMNKLSDGQSNITGVRPPRPLVKQEKNMTYNDHGLGESMDFVDTPSFEMDSSFRRSDYKSTPREDDVKGIFGGYGEDVPPSVLRYMRKNPEKIVKRLYDIYGDKMMDYLPMGPMDEAEEEMVKKTTYTKSEIDQAKSKGVGIEANGTVTPNSDGGMTITSKQ